MLQSSGLDFVIRSNHDRKISTSPGESLEAHIQLQTCVDEYVLEVQGDNRQRRKCMARMELHYEQVSLRCPADVVPAGKYPSELEVYVVHVKEKADSVPQGESPIEWTLYASHRDKSVATLHFRLPAAFRQQGTNVMNVLLLSVFHTHAHIIAHYSHIF